MSRQRGPSALKKTRARLLSPRSPEALETRYRRGTERRLRDAIRQRAVRTSLVVQRAPEQLAPKHALRMLAGLTGGALFAVVLLAWSFAPHLREGLISRFDDATTASLESLLADRWRPAPQAYDDFAEQTLRPGVSRPGFALDSRGAVRAVFVDHSRLPLQRALRVADTLVDEAAKLGVDPLLMLAVIDVESKFDHQAQSLRGARGLMQLMPETRAWMIDRTPGLWSETGKDDGFEPESNVRVGVNYFAHLARGFRTVEHVLQAYNCGPARLVEILRGEAVLPEESKYYADRVLRIYARLRREYDYVRT